MTAPLSPEALVERERRALAQRIDQVLADDIYFGRQRPSVRAKQRERLIEGAFAPLLAALKQVTAERDAYRDGEEISDVMAQVGFDRMMEVCKERDTANAEIARLRAEGEAKDRAILLLLPFVDYAAGEGLMFVETEDGEHPEMDAADIMAAVAEPLGLELGSDAYLSLLPKGYFAIRAALAARAATAREGE